MIGIPDAVTLQLTSPLEDIPCRSEDIFFDLSSCTPTWSPEFDFFFILLKALLLYTLPLIFMSIAYFHIVKTLWKRSVLPGDHSQGRNVPEGSTLECSNIPPKKFVSAKLER